MRRRTTLYLVSGAIVLISGSPAAAAGAGSPGPAAIQVAPTPPPRPTGEAAAARLTAPAPSRLAPDGPSPEGLRQGHDPVFVGSPARVAVGSTPVLVGTSGWIAANAPFDRQLGAGGPAFGLTLAWPAGGTDSGPANPPAQESNSR